jgi:hypothetical protein
MGLALRGADRLSVQLRKNTTQDQNWPRVVFYARRIEPYPYCFSAASNALTASSISIGVITVSQNVEKYDISVPSSFSM